jgi:hypothetical protein
MTAISQCSANYSEMPNHVVHSFIHSFMLAAHHSSRRQVWRHGVMARPSPHLISSRSALLMTLTMASIADSNLSVKLGHRKQPLQRLNKYEPTEEKKDNSYVLLLQTKLPSSSVNLKKIQTRGVDNVQWMSYKAKGTRTAEMSI